MGARVVTDGPLTWSLQEDDKGYRTYSVQFRVKTDHPHEGPRIASRAAGLPVPGSAWSFGFDYDPWVWCRMTRSTKPVIVGEPCRDFIVEIEFSNRPLSQDDGSSSCRDQEIEDPLLQPPKITTGWRSKQVQGQFDRHGRPIATIYREKFSGQQNEWHAFSDVVRIERNVLLSSRVLAGRFKGAVNDLPLWGYPARSVMVTGYDREEMFHGLCFRYFRETLEFEIDVVLDQDNPGQYVSGHDRNFVHTGTKVPRGRWDTDPESTSFGIYLVEEGLDLTPYLPNNLGNLPEFSLVEYLDKQGNKSKVVYSDTYPGLPINCGVLHDGGILNIGDTPHSLRIERAPSANLYLLGIPNSID